MRFIPLVCNLIFRFLSIFLPVVLLSRSISIFIRKFFLFFYFLYKYTNARKKESLIFKLSLMFFIFSVSRTLFERRFLFEIYFRNSIVRISKKYIPGFDRSISPHHYYLRGYNKSYLRPMLHMDPGKNNSCDFVPNH